MSRGVVSIFHNERGKKKIKRFSETIFIDLDYEIIGYYFIDIVLRKMYC